jgi:pyruvate,water dikinase
MLGGTEHSAVQRAMEALLADYGHRAFCLDLSCPRYADDPAQVWAAVRQMMALEDSPDDAPKPVVRQPRWGSRFSWKSGGLRALMGFTARYVALREEQRFEWQRALHLMRRVFVHLETEWIAQGWLSQPGDVFVLTWDELRAMVTGRQAVSARQIAVRRRQFRRAQDAPHPRFLRGDSPYEAEMRPTTGRLVGVGASAGQAEGRARVLPHPGSLAELLEQIEEGDILVTQAADPGWTPAFGQLRALVMSVGGTMSHGAIVAREYGLPAVVAVEDALWRITDGDHLLVDGSSGYVTIIDAPETVTAADG